MYSLFRPPREIRSSQHSGLMPSFTALALTSFEADLPTLLNRTKLKGQIQSPFLLPTETIELRLCQLLTYKVVYKSLLMNLKLV